MSSFLIALLVPIVLTALTLGVRSRARHINGTRFIEYGAAFRGFTVFMTVLAAIIAIASLFLSHTDRLWMLGISGLFFILGTPLLLHAYFTRILFDSIGITALSPWHKNISVAWCQIINVYYSAGERCFVVLTPSGGQIKLHAYMSGVSELITEMQSRSVRGALLAQAMAKQSY
jgi:hypothetical protein